MKKKLLAVITALALCLTLTPTVAFASPVDAGDGTAPGGDIEGPDGGSGKPINFSSMQEYYDVYYDPEGFPYTSVTVEINGEDFETFGLFIVPNTQKSVDPPKLTLILKNCTFTGNTAGDEKNPSFMYLPNCEELIIEGCTFNAGDEGLKYGINWNLIGVQNSEVTITGCTFNGKYIENAIKLNQRLGKDDIYVEDMEELHNLGVEAGSIESATISGCKFNDPSAIIALGSKGKGEEGAAAPSTGEFPVTIKDNKTDVTVRLDYNAGENDTPVSATVEAGETFGKTEDGKITHSNHNYVNGQCIVCGKEEPSTGGETTGGGTTGGTTGGGTVTPSVTKSRVAGDDRFQTAIKVADKLKSELGVVKFNNIVVANSDEFADALSATALAADKDAPILVVNKNNESTVKTYIANNLNKGGNVYIIGGTAVVSESFEKSLTNCKVTRLGGSDRYETNLEVLKTLGVTGASDIMVASGLKYPDALSASATGNPVLLVGKTLTDNQKAYLATLGGNDDYYVIGGTAAVNADVAKAVDAYGTVTRLGGDTRYETGLAVADEFFTNARTVVIASGDDFPDGLTGGVLANAMNAPLMLVNQYNTDVAADYVDDNSVRTVIAIGGTTVIPDATLNKVA